MVHIRHHTMTPTARTTVTIGLAVPVAATVCRLLDKLSKSVRTVSSEGMRLELQLSCKQTDE